MLSTSTSVAARMVAVRGESLEDPDLAEELSFAQPDQDDVRLAGRLADHVHLALADDVQPVGIVALAEDDLAGLEALLDDAAQPRPDAGPDRVAEAAGRQQRSAPGRPS